jgi:Reverse transcriptase (RNA-dependent DNA polymerase)
MARIAGSTTFSKLDKKSAFDQLRMREGDKAYTASATSYGTFEYVVIPFELKNAPSTFQRFINHVLGEVIWDGIEVYIDDIVLHTKSSESQKKLLRKVREILERNKLELNKEKCKIKKKRMEFLGEETSKGKFMVPSRIIKTMLDFPLLETKKSVQRYRDVQLL